MSDLHPAGGCTCEDASGTCAYCRSVKAEARVQAVIDAIEITWPRPSEPERVVARDPVPELARAVRLVRTEEQAAQAEYERPSWRNPWRQA